MARSPALLDLIGQYPVLETLASYLSTLDLFHLGLTCRDSHAYILSSPQIFRALRWDCLCDGHGLHRRQNVWHHPDRKAMWGSGRKIHGDEEIEVKLFAAKCDEAGALPCVKCGINICEECRQYPRVLSRGSYPEDRRPHLNGSRQSDNVMCLCDACDTKLEGQLRGQFLNELCDCDRYRRWICLKCAKEERNWTREYYKQHTVREGADFYDQEESFGLTKVMMDHQFDILFYCICGSLVPKTARPRCTWCKRKHRPEEEWEEEMREMRDIPFDDGCYPVFVPDATSYPRLAYNGPIYQGPSNNDNAGSKVT